MLLAIHESRLRHIRGTAGEDVVFHFESRCNKEDAPRSARPEGKECRLLKGIIGVIYPLLSFAFRNDSLIYKNQI